MCVFVTRMSVYYVYIYEMRNMRWIEFQLYSSDGENRNNLENHRLLSGFISIFVTK